MDIHSRRQFLLGSTAAISLGVLAGCGVPPIQSPPKVPTLGVLLYSSPAADANLNAFLQGLRDLGYSDGQNLAIEYRYAEARPERLPDLAAELVRLKPDLIFALGGDVAAATKGATSTIPVVMANSADPVAQGLVASLAHPGGNITGVTLATSDLAGKRLQLLKEILPSISRVGILWNPEHADPDFQETQAAAAVLGLQLDSQEVRRPGDFDEAFQAIVSGRDEGLTVVPSRLTGLYVQQIVEFVTKSRLPMVSGWGVFARRGGLLTYGPNQDNVVRGATSYVHKILSGAKPSDLPIERPTEFELVVNLKTAKALGLTIPQSILVQVTERIE